MYAQFNTRRIALSLMALAVTLLSASPALAGDGTKYELFQRVQEQVLRYSFFTVFDNIGVEIAEEGHVVLTGHVTGEHKASDIEKRVVALDGVTAVTNEIVVLPASGFDNRLRYASLPARSMGILLSGTTPPAVIRRSTSWWSVDT